MPWNYNRPAWLDEEYLRLSANLISQIKMHFKPNMTNHQVMRGIHEVNPYLVSDGEAEAICWLGDDRNIGANSLLETPPEILYHLLPSVTILCLETHSDRVSEAEDSVLPELMVQSLAPRRVGLDRVSKLANMMSVDDHQIVCQVLRLMLNRQGFIGETAWYALEDFWSEKLVAEHRFWHNPD